MTHSLTAEPGHQKVDEPYGPEFKLDQTMMLWLKKGGEALYGMNCTVKSILRWFNKVNRNHPCFDS